MAVKFLNTGNFPDNVKLTFGNDSDIEIYSDNSTAYIEMPNLTNFIIGDSTTFNTGNIALVRVAELTGTKSIEEDWMGMYTSANTGFSYMTSSGSVKLQTSSTGITVTGGIEVGGAASRFSNSVRFTANATFDDNSKALFGDDSDLQIYHDGTDSYID